MSLSSCYLQVNRSDESATSPSPSQLTSKASSPIKTVSPKRSPSPSPRASSPTGRRRWATAELELADIPADPVVEPNEDIHSSQHQQLGSFSGPMTYQHFLMGTSYLDRLKKLQRRQQYLATR
ncbi:hypothetical protein DVH05_027551 [Phytophthora capsici]|nr:hypothetical protein DVH05_027551 [Phytophthora capsici]